MGLARDVLVGDAVVTLAYIVQGAANARRFADLHRSEGYLVTGDAKPRHIGYAVSVHAEDADVELVDAIAQSVSPPAVRVP